jgi:hypothetical protein
VWCKQGCLRALFQRKAENLIDRATGKQGSNAIMVHCHPGALSVPREAVKEGSMVMHRVTARASKTDLQG